MAANRSGDVSVVIPTYLEADYLGEALASVAAQTTARDVEAVVVDGGSDDGTRAIAREHGARVVHEPGAGIAAARNRGAALADGDWLFFVDADTRLRPPCVERLVDFAEREGLDAAAPRCRVVGDPRGKGMELVINHVFSRLKRPVLPGFATLVDAGVHRDVGGFPTVPNEDTAFSRLLGREYDTAYCPETLVETSGRRFARDGVAGALAHYVRLDWRRVRADY